MYRGTHPYEMAEPRRVEGLTLSEVCMRYQKKVLMLARRVFERLSSDASVQVDDLVSSGAIGLIEAFERFDESRGIQFSTYAEYRIRGAMYDMLRDNDTFTRRRRQMANHIEQVTDQLHQALGRPPTPEESAHALNVPLEKYWKMVDKVKSVSHVSIDGPSSGDEEGRPLLEKIMDRPGEEPEKKLLVQEVKSVLKDAIQNLPQRQQECVLMYYGKEASLAEIAEVYGVTVSRVSQILNDARTHLRKQLEPLLEPSEALEELV